MTDSEGRELDLVLTYGNGDTVYSGSGLDFITIGTITMAAVGQTEEQEKWTLKFLGSVSNTGMVRSLSLGIHPQRLSMSRP